MPLSTAIEDDLRKRLVDAKLAGTRAPQEFKHEYHFHSNEQAADLAVAVVLDWMADTLPMFKTYVAQ